MALLDQGAVLGSAAAILAGGATDGAGGFRVAWLRPAALSEQGAISYRSG